ncbi:uncharacterized protein EDB91DRAFT_1337623 [Suillus paluster]|uniref:uncharacterized protein n=1 Tax=Suillus paluster TaxID=48578 RepID=UPI001B869242|nr:uncharacterized protein EDB91DRAFT_1337623 [Suillus paluster]KAG1735598.1 hypothetical protein EDB91DRAFT_1337623 [Suillus paluster]
MPPKRKSAKPAPAQPKPAPPPPQAAKPAPVPQAVKPAPAPQAAKPAPAPQAVKPAPPPPPPPPVETPSAKVRKEWQNFISSWYEPEKKKLIDQLTKELDLKYKKSTSRIQQTARLTEKEKRLSEIATQLAEPAHEEWNNRLAAAQLQVDDWTDITDQEQQSVISVFVVFFQDDEDNEEDEESTTFDSNETEESVASAVEEPQFLDASPFFTVRQSPPTPVTANFELVNPSSFFTDTISPLNQARKLPELAMDNLALNNLNTGRSQPDATPSTSAVFGFQAWASEAGLAVPPTPRHRATDNISRQPSQASTSASSSTSVSSASASTSTSTSSPLFASHHSPPQPTSKISPLAVTHTLPPGKRYIGPVIAEEEPEPISIDLGGLDSDLLKAKMAADFLEFKTSIRIQMIHQFHAKASEIEIELVRQLESNNSNSNSSRESRLRTMQEHEENMMSLRESKEMERKKLCDAERDRRLQEHQFLRQVAAQKAKETRVNASASSSKIPQTGWTTTHSAPKLPSQKENLSTGSIPTLPKPDPPSILKKSISARSHTQTQDILPGFDEAAFFKAQAEAANLVKGKQPLATASASTSASNPLGRPSALKKTETANSQDEPVEPVVPPQPQPPTAQAPTPSSAKGKKGKKTPAAQQPKTVTFNEAPDTDAEPPPSWGANANAKSAGKGAKSPLSLSSKPSKSVMIEEEPDEDADPPFSAWNLNVRGTTPASSASASASASAKKGKAAVIAEDPIPDPSPPVTSAFGWGSASNSNSNTTNTPIWASGAAGKKAKAKAPIVIAPPDPADDPFQTWTAPSGGWDSGSGSAAGKKTGTKTKVTVTEELDEAAVSMAWSAGVKTTSSSSAAAGKQAKKVVPQPQPQLRQSSLSKSAWVEDAEEEDDEEDDDDEEEEEEEEEEVWSSAHPTSSMPGAIPTTASDENDAWGSSYWTNLSNGQPVSHAHAQITEDATNPSATHMRWTPSMEAPESGDEDSDAGGADENMESALWMQYAISGGDVSIPGFEVQAPAVQEHVQVAVKTAAANGNGKTTTSSHANANANANVGANANIWDQGKGKKKSTPVHEPAKIEPPRSHQPQTQTSTSASSNANANARTAQWPKAKMASRLGQSSGSARHL